MKQKKNIWIRATAGSGLLLGAALASAGNAGNDTAADTAAATETIAATMPTVIVTATRRAASIQSVPVAVSVIDGDQLERSNRCSRCTGAKRASPKTPASTRSSSPITWR